LELWHVQFDRTKTDIENELTIVRWEFTNQKAFKDKPIHMSRILANFKETCIVMKQFFAILNDQLKAVTGSQTEITQVSSRVTEAVQKLSSFEGDVFISGDPSIEA